jgi:nucleoside phosphorylase
VSTEDGVRIVILTALPVEYRAVREHLSDLRRRSDPSGTQFEVGTLGPGRVALAEVGTGNVDAALVAAAAIVLFDPDAMFFVGVAGALDPKLELGSVVVATRVYAVHGGKEQDGRFLARPRSYDADHELLQRARFVARDFHRPGVPEVRFAPIAAGEVVLNSRTTPLARQLHQHYNDADAIEMESAGMARAGHVGRVRVLTVRGLSDKADGGKAAADAGGSQPTAAGNAAAFAALVITDYLSGDGSTGVRREPASSVQNVTAAGGGTAYGVMHGDLHLHEAEPPKSVRWRPVSPPPQVSWRSDLVPRRAAVEWALELHLVPVTAFASIEVRRLRELAGRLAGGFPAGTRPESGFDDRAAWAYTADHPQGPAGLVVGRSGQRSAWEPMPSDSLGAVLDEEWIAACLDRLITTLIGLDLPAAVRWAPAVAVHPATMISVGRAGSLPRSSASLGMPRGPLRVPPDESVPADHLASLTRDVAAELAARLLAAFDRR